MYRKSIFLKIKDWMEIKMPASRFLNVCIGLGLLILACGAAVHFSAPVILALLQP